MRSWFVIALLSIVLILAGLALVPRLVVWDDYRDQLTRQAEAITGQTVTIDGRIDLSLLPQPTLALGDTTLIGQAGEADRVSMTVDRLDLQLKPLPLLGGLLDVTSVRLVRPVLQVEPAPDGRLDLRQLAVAGVVWPMVTEGPNHVSVIDGRVVVRERTIGDAREIGQINVEVSAGATGTAIEIDGTFTYGTQPFQLIARLGRPTEGGASTVRLELVADGLGARTPTTLTYGGIVGWQPEAPRLRGQIVLTGGDVGSAIAAIAGGLGAEPPPWPAPAATPFRVAGPIGMTGDGIVLPELELSVADTVLRGGIRLERAPEPEIELKLEAREIAVPGRLPASGLSAAIAPLSALSSAVSGSIDLSVDELSYRGGDIRRLRATVSLSGDGETAIEQVRAILPGQTDVTLSGRLHRNGRDVEVQGAVRAVAEDLRAGLDWLGVAVADVPEGRLRSLSLAGDFSLDHQALRLSDAELRVDASRASGSLAVNFAERPRLAASVVVDRLNVDAYWPEAELADLYTLLMASLPRFDAAIEARARRLTWGGVRLHDLRFDGRAVGGLLTVDELAVSDLADSEARLRGEIEAGGVFDLAAQLDGVRVTRMLRHLDIMPPPMLGRVGPLTIEAAAQGTAEAFLVDVSASDGRGQIGLRGEVGWAGDGAHYLLDVEAAHPNYHELLRGLGKPLAGDATTPAPLTVTGKLREDPGGEASVTGTARLGETSFTGRVAWPRESARPQISAKLSVGEPTAQVLGGLLDVVGLRLELPAANDGAFAGDWSTRRLAFRWLDAFDGELELSSKGGLAGSGLELRAQLDQGSVSVDLLSAALWGGRMEGSLALEVRRQLPFVTLAADLDAVSPARLGAWLGLPALVSGTADISIEATAAGHSVRQLVGSSIGTIELTMADGAFAATLPEGFEQVAETWQGETPTSASLSGSFALSRGIATAQSVDARVAGVPADLEGLVDLLVWAADLTLRPEGPGPPLRIVGPLDRPQIGFQAPSGTNHDDLLP